MKTLVHRIYTHPRYAKAVNWGLLVSITAFAQIIIQAIGLICGILVIRLLPVREYALYTLANAMLGTMVILADGGIAAGVMAQGAKAWKDKQYLGTVLATGLNLRKKFAVWSLLIALPLLFWLLQRNGAGGFVSVLIIVALIPAFFTSLSGNLLRIVPKLTLDIAPLQKIQVGAAGARLILLFLFLFIFPWAFVAILAAGFPQIWANKRLRKLSGEHAVINKHSDRSVRKEIIAIVRRTLPYAIYYCLFEQITIWLISIFGTTPSVAEVGALDRVATVLVLFTVLFNTLVIPGFARLPANEAILRNRFFRIQTGLLLFGGFIILMASIFSSQVLWILGPPYSHLRTEFILSIVSSCIFIISGMLISLIASRGWVINPIVIIPLNLLTVTCGIMLVDVSTVKGVFIFNILVMGTTAIMNFCYGLIKISKVNDVTLTNS